MFSSIELNRDPIRKRSEGIALNFNFIPDKAYRVSYWVMNRVHLTNNSVPKGITILNAIIPSTVMPENCDDYLLPPIPPGSIVSPNANLVLDQWVHNEFIFRSPNPKPQLWFRPFEEVDPNQPNEMIFCGRVHIDDVKIEQLPDTCICDIGQNCTQIGFNGGTTRVLDGNTTLPNFYFGCYNVCGTLDVNQDFTMYSTTVNMSPGARILVRTGVTLTLSFANLKGCSSMWQGIELEPGANINWVAGSIEDAQFGVNCTGNANIQYGLSCNFKNCYVGIHSPATTGSRKVISSLLLYNTFDFTGFKPFFPGQSPMPQSRTFAGIEMNNATFFLDKGPNTFLNLQNGVVARNSDISANQCNITNMIPQVPTIARCSPSMENPDGFGIYYSACRNIANVRNNTITNTIGGVVTRFSGLQATDNIISNTLYGIYCDRILTRIPTIASENHINNFRAFGIKMANPNYFNVIEIVHNICTSAVNPSAMECFGAVIHLDRAYCATRARIEDNEGRCVYAHDGIRLNSSRNIVAQGNEFHFMPTTFPFLENGIEVNTCSKIWVYSNNVTGVSTSRPIGSFEQVSSPDVIYCCNSSNLHSVGFRFEGGNPRTVFQSSLINSHRFGVRVESKAEISDQFFHGNQWLAAAVSSGSFTGYNAINLNGDPFIKNNSQFIIANCPSSFWPTSIFPPQGNAQTSCSFITTDWFWQGDGADMACPSLECTPIIFPPIVIGDNGDPGDGDGNFNPVTDGDIINRTDGNTVLGWEAKRSLMLRLIEHPAQVNGSVLYSSFYNAANNATIYAYSLVENQMNNANRLSQGLRDSINSLNIIIANLENQYQTTLAGLASASNQADTILIMNQANLYFASMSQQAELLNQLNSNVIGELNTKLDLAAVANEALTANTAFQLNEKELNKILIHSIMRGNEVTVDEKAMLLYIATQCPYEGGRSVYQARSMYNNLESYTWDDEIFCAPSQALKKAPEAMQVDELSITPNPSQGEMLIQWNDATIQIKEVQLMNAFNQKLSEWKVNPTVQHLNIQLSNLPDGIYILNCKKTDNNMISKKIVIRK